MAIESVKAKQTERTRRRIRSAALRLFNRRGTTQVHTHDIARAASISPGNLYYHYKNKEEIIREIVLGIPIYDGLEWERAVLPLGPADFRGFLESFFKGLGRHRFFFREFSILVRKDEKLGASWRSTFVGLERALEGAARHWVKVGMLRPFPRREDLDAFVHNAWILLHSCESFLEVESGTSGRTIHEGAVKLVLSFLTPYHTDAGQKEIRRFLNGK